MDMLELIHSRRSVRNFSRKPVSEELIHALLDAGMAAPSAGNARPWHFVVVDDLNILDNYHEVNPYAAMAAKASLMIVVCADPHIEKYPGFWVQDCSAAVQNILLAAVALGLGAVWTGVYPVEERVVKIRSLLNLPEGIMPLASLVIGHTEVRPEYKSRFEQDKVHRNAW